MRRMYSKKQLEELISKMSGDILEVKNVKQLNDEQCNSLKVGDVVAKKTGKQYHLYLVTYKQDKHGLCLSYFDASCIETQSYDYTAGHWAYNSEDKTSFADIGGLPDVTALDNGKVLEVIAGAWSKGSGKVSLMPIPASTTLTDDEKTQIMSGAFMNGVFLGIRNPVFFPSEEAGGFVIGGDTNGRPLIGMYNFASNVISLSSDNYIRYSGTASYATNILDIKSANMLNIRGDNVSIHKLTSLNQKTFPNYPANTAIGQFICRKGTLEWYIPVAVTGITSGDDLAGVQDTLVNAMKDHLDVEINGYRARYQYEENGYVVYSSMAEADSGVNLQVNMISLLIASPNTISFNQMKFAPVV